MPQVRTARKKYRRSDKRTNQKVERRSDKRTNKKVDRRRSDKRTNKKINRRRNNIVLDGGAIDLAILKDHFGLNEVELRLEPYLDVSVDDNNESFQEFKAILPKSDENKGVNTLQSFLELLNLGQYLKLFNDKGYKNVDDLVNKDNVSLRTDLTISYDKNDPSKILTPGIETNEINKLLMKLSLSEIYWEHMILPVYFHYYKLLSPYRNNDISFVSNYRFFLDNKKNKTKYFKKYIKYLEDKANLIVTSDTLKEDLYTIDGMQPDFYHFKDYMDIISLFITLCELFNKLQIQDIQLNDYFDISEIDKIVNRHKTISAKSGRTSDIAFKDRINPSTFFKLNTSQTPSYIIFGSFPTFCHHKLGLKVVEIELEILFNDYKDIIYKLYDHFIQYLDHSIISIYVLLENQVSRGDKYIHYNYPNPKQKELYNLHIFLCNYFEGFLPKSDRDNYFDKLFPTIPPDPGNALEKTQKILLAIRSGSTWGLEDEQKNYLKKLILFLFNFNANNKKTRHILHKLHNHPNAKEIFSYNFKRFFPEFLKKMQNSHYPDEYYDFPDFLKTDYNAFEELFKKYKANNEPFGEGLINLCQFKITGEDTLISPSPENFVTAVSEYPDGGICKYALELYMSKFPGENIKKYEAIHNKIINTLKEKQQYNKNKIVLPLVIPRQKKDGKVFDNGKYQEYMKKLCVNIMKSGLERVPFSGSADDFKPTLEQFKEILCDDDWTDKGPDQDPDPDPDPDPDSDSDSDPIPVRDNWMGSEPELPAFAEPVKKPEPVKNPEPVKKPQPPPTAKLGPPINWGIPPVNENKRLQLEGLGGGSEGSYDQPPEPGSGEDDDTPSSTNVDGISSIVNTILTCYGENVNITDELVEAKARDQVKVEVTIAREKANAEVATAKEQAESQVMAAQNAAEQAEIAKRKALEAEAKALEAKTEAEEQAQAQTEAAQAEAQAQVEAAKKEAQAQVEAAQAEAQAQVEAAQVEAQAQVEAAEKAKTALVAAQAQAQEEAAKKLELQKDIDDNKKEIETFFKSAYTGENTQAVLRDIKGDMDKLTNDIDELNNIIKSLKGEIPSKMDQINTKIGKINEVFKSIKKINEENGKAIKGIFSSLLDFPREIKDKIEGFLTDVPDVNKTIVISYIDGLVKNQRVLDEAQGILVKELNDRINSVIDEKEIKGLLMLVQKLLNDIEETINQSNISTEEAKTEGHEGGSINDGNGGLKLDILNYSHIGGTNIGSIRNKIDSVIANLLKNDKKMKDIVCSNRENQRKLDEMEHEDNSAEHTAIEFVAETQKLKESLNARQTEAQKILEARKKLKKLVPLDTGNQKTDGEPIAENALPPQNGGSLSLDY